MLIAQVIVNNSEEVSLAVQGAWQDCFGFSEDFRKGLLSLIAELTPTEVFSGGSKVILVPQSITAPEEIEKGKWKVISLVIYGCEYSHLGL